MPQHAVSSSLACAASDGRLVARIGASCTTIRLRGDAGPGRPVETRLRCRAYNGDTGMTMLLPGQAVDYGPARRRTLRWTSQPVALQVLSVLRADAARRTTPPSQLVTAPRS